MRLDLADLRLFLHVVDAGSITQGAARAHLALASASERLRGMEADVGLALLERRHRGVVPTEAGEALAHHARLILRQRERLRDELHDFAGGLRGTLRLHANTAALTGFLPTQLAPWLARRPQLKVELKERTSSDIVHAVAAGLVEAGIVSDAVDAGGLHTQVLASDHLVLAMAPGHPLAATAPRGIALRQVLDEPFVGLAHGSALQAHVEQQAQRAGGALALRIRMADIEGVCAMVSQGVGLGVVPRAAVQLHRRRHPLRVAALSDTWARRNLCLCTRGRDTLSAPMRDLADHLASACSAGAAVVSGAGPDAPETTKPGRGRAS